MPSSQQQKEFVHPLRSSCAAYKHPYRVQKYGKSAPYIWWFDKVLPLQVGIVSFQTPGWSLLEATHVTDVGPFS